MRVFIQNLDYHQVNTLKYGDRLLATPSLGILAKWFCFMFVADGWAICDIPEVFAKEKPSPLYDGHYFLLSKDGEALVKEYRNGFS